MVLIETRDGSTFVCGALDMTQMVSEKMQQQMENSDCGKPAPEGRASWSVNAAVNRRVR